MYVFFPQDFINMLNFEAEFCSAYHIVEQGRLCFPLDVSQIGTQNQNPC
jgi:hypothetical protein